MPNYQNSKIYKIYGDSHDLVYFGSTTLEYLSQRLIKHKHAYKTGVRSCSSHKVLETGDYKIELVEKYPCNDKDELVKQERYYIENFPCVNIKHEGRTKKEYYEDNKDKINEQHKQYYYENKDKIKELVKQYHKDNKDKIRERKKQYREKNKERLRMKTICECGSVVLTTCISRHKKTNKHKNWLSSQE